ncbi:MAG: hypothetical protein E7565_10145, partial [Ruminococcaceae bacterium]|nr:hypothetical protein [Oscillospiraceae bacterium]
MKKYVRRSMALLVAIVVFSASIFSGNVACAASSVGVDYSDYYGTQLSGIANELDAFFREKFIVKQDATNGELTLKNPITFKAEIKGNQIIENDEFIQATNKLNVALQNATDAFLTDHPEVFWLYTIGLKYSIGASYSSNGWTGHIKKIIIEPHEVYTGASDKIAQYEVAVDGVVQNIRNNVNNTNNRAELLKEIHDYVCENAFYSFSVTDKYVFHSSLPVFIGNGEVVCEGYAKAFKVLCDEFGIPCVLVHGVASTGNVEGEAHMWNYVQLDDGKWYLVDATWDDQVSAIKKTYFLAGYNSDGFYEKIKDERIAYGDFSVTGYKEFQYPELSNEGYFTYTHNWKSNYTIDKKATLTSNGEMSRYCANDDCTGKTDVTVIDKIAKVELSATSYTYNGSVFTPTVLVKDAAGKTLKKDTDYTVTYASGRKNVGSYDVMVTFKGKYSGSKKLTFKVNAASAS